MGAMGKWLLLFLLTPLAEIYILVEIGAHIGAWPTIALVMLTALVGVVLLKHQGLATFLHARRKLATGELPLREMVEGLLLAVAGVLLVTPGFVTDAVGFALLVPPARAAGAQRLLAWLPARGTAAPPSSAARTFDQHSRPR